MTKPRPRMSHYQQTAIEPIDVIFAQGQDFYVAFCLGNIIKYALRCQHRGMMREDLEKIQAYAQFLIDGSP